MRRTMYVRVHEKNERSMYEEEMGFWEAIQSKIQSTQYNEAVAHWRKAN
jgi:hypothetical protein